MKDDPQNYLCILVDIDTDAELKVVLSLYNLPNQTLIERFAHDHLDGKWALVDWRETDTPSDYSPLL